MRTPFRATRLFIFIGFVAIGGIALLNACRQNDWQAAERDAKEYVSHLPGSTGEVQCAHKDSDGDGYCSCSAFMKDGTVQPLDCGCEIYCVRCAEGCKVQLPFKMVAPKTP